MNLEKIIGQRILKARKARKMTQTDLALKTNFSRTTICQIERGNELTNLKGIYKICFALSIDIHDVLPSIYLQKDRIFEFLNSENDTGVSNA